MPDPLLDGGNGGLLQTVHRVACHACGTTDDSCLSLGALETCCQACAVTAALTHSRYVHPTTGEQRPVPVPAGYLEQQQPAA